MPMAHAPSASRPPPHTAVESPSGVDLSLSPQDQEREARLLAVNSTLGEYYRTYITLRAIIFLGYYEYYYYYYY